MSRNKMLNTELGTKAKLNTDAVQSLSWGVSKLENGLCTSTEICYAPLHELSLTGNTSGI